MSVNISFIENSDRWNQPIFRGPKVCIANRGEADEEVGEEKNGEATTSSMQVRKKKGRAGVIRYTQQENHGFRSQKPLLTYNL